MAGFIDRIGVNPVFGQISKSLKNLANLGMRYEDMVVKQSRAIGVTEAEFGNQGYLPEEFLYSLALSDVGQKKFIAFFDKDYKARRDYLRKFAMNPEIEFVVDTIADEAIVYDDSNYFCNVDIGKVREVLSPDNQKEVISELNQQFKKIYAHFHFSGGHDAWAYFRQLLIDGFISFEIIFDPDGKNIVGFKELDPISLRPGVEKASDGTYKKIWVQYEDIPAMKRVLLDSQVIYISYAKGNFTGRVSYVERMVRSFNLLRIMENSRVIWNIMNASYRMKMVVPIGTKSPQKAKEALAEMINIYKEDVNLNQDSGELSINGSPSMQFYKNYLFPSKNGESPDISVMGGEGFDLSDPAQLQYFKDKLIEDSKIPGSRFDKGMGGGGGGQYSISADGIDREEIRFFKFITRLRSIYQEIVLKPLFIQMGLIYPELAEDELFKSTLAITYNKDNIFEELKQMDMLGKRLDFASNMMQIMDKKKDATGMDVDVPYFTPRFVIEKYLKLSQDDIAANERMKAEQAEKDLADMKLAQQIQQQSDGGMGGF
jgi:hypothetical protein